MISIFCALMVAQAAPPNGLAAPVVLAQDISERQHGGAQQGSAPSAKDRGTGASDTSQRGSLGSTPGGEERTGPPAAGIESGDANGLAGGRTDEGPQGGTGIRSGTDQSARARANAADQARGRNARGSLLRPADSPPTINRRPRPIGSGAPNVAPELEPQVEGQNFGSGRSPEGRAGGLASGEDNPGASSPAGVAGKSSRTQPHDHEADDSVPQPR